MFQGIPLDSFQAQFFGRLLSSGVRRDQLPRYVKLAEDRFGPVAGQWLREGLTKLAVPVVPLQPPAAPVVPLQQPAAPVVPLQQPVAPVVPLQQPVAPEPPNWGEMAQNWGRRVLGFPSRTEEAEVRQTVAQAKALMADPMQVILGKDGGKFFAENKSWLIPLLLGGTGIGLGGAVGGGTGAALGGIGLPLIYMLMNNPEMLSKFTGMFGSGAKTETPPVAPPTANPGGKPPPTANTGGKSPPPVNPGGTPSPTTNTGGKPLPPATPGVALLPKANLGAVNSIVPPPELASQTAVAQLPVSRSPTSPAGQPPAITPEVASTNDLPTLPNLMPPVTKFAEVPVVGGLPPALTPQTGATPMNSQPTALARMKADMARKRQGMAPAIADDQRQRAALQAAGKPVPNTLTQQRVGGQLLQPGQPTPQQQQIQGLSHQLNDGLPPNIMPPAFPKVKPAITPALSKVIPSKSKTFDP